MSLNEFEIVKRLGEGAYSSVYHVRRHTDGETYALKKVKMQKLSDKEKENALNEVRILASIQHSNIVAYKEAFIDEPSQSLCIVMEYADNGDLFQQICDHQNANTLFKEDDIWKIFIQMIRGLKCLHEMLIFHRDLKSANVFLNKDGSAKLGDMNVSKVAKKGLLYTQTGTPYYASPEVWKDQPYDHKSDIWSLGCVLYESISLKPPFRAEDMQGLYKKVLRGIYPKIPNVYSQDLANLVKSMIQVSPQLRPTCDKILEMPSIKKKSEKLFPEEYFYQSQSSLLNTIRVPKNLLYLTDRLPKPQYSSAKKKEEEDKRRRTFDPAQQQVLPDIKNQKHKNSGQLPPPGAPGQKKKKTGMLQLQQQSSVNSTQKPSVTQLRPDLQLSHDNHDDNQSVKPKPSPIKNDEDRKSILSRNSRGQSQANDKVNQQLQDNAPPIMTSKSVISKQTTGGKRKKPPLKQENKANEEYENDGFENDDKEHQQQHQRPIQTQISKNSLSPSKISAKEDNDSVYQDSPQSAINHITPISKKSNLTNKISSPSQVMLQNRQAYSNAGSIERIYIQRPQQQISNPYIKDSNSLLQNGLNQDTNTTSKKNLHYINITGDSRQVGSLGLKKAEKDLIMRRYKYNHQTNDNIQRVALIYGQPTSSQNQLSTGASNLSSSPYSYNLNSQYINNPYLNSQAHGGSNLSGIMKRNKYILDESGNGSQIRLPRIQSLGRHQQQENSGQQVSKLLPPIPGNQQSVNGIVINKINSGIPPAYNQYILKPTKLKTINKPMLSSGVSGEKMQINMPNHSYKLNLNNQSNGSNSTALSNVINIENQKLNLNSNHSLIGKGSHLSGVIRSNQYGSSPPSQLNPNIDINSQGGRSEIKKVIKKRRNINHNDSNNQNNNGLAVE